MLHEVGAEASLHAGGPDVGRVLLDPWRADVDDGVVLHLEVDLAPDATVGADAAHRAIRCRHVLRPHVLPDLAVGRADGHRDDVVDGAGGADAHALAAPGAPGVLGIAVGADNDLGMVAAVGDVEDADDLDVLAGADAARAEDAGAHVVPDDRVAVALVAGAERHAGPPDCGHVVAAHQLLELVAVSAVGNLVDRVALEQHGQDALPALDRGDGLGGHLHAVGRLRRAGGDELGIAFHRDEADAAVADGGELRIPAERRHVDLDRARGVENGPAVGNGNVVSVDDELRHGDLLPWPGVSKGAFRIMRAGGGRDQRGAGRWRHPPDPAGVVAGGAWPRHPAPERLVRRRPPAGSGPTAARKPLRAPRPNPIIRPNATACARGPG